MGHSAAKPVESGLDALPAGSRSSFFFPPQKGGEDRLLMVLVLVSAVAHIVVLLVGDFSWTRDKPPLSDEWVMDVNLMTDFDDSSGRVALPKATVAPEAKVPVDMLPQLPKVVSVKEPVKAEEAIAEEKEKEPPPKEIKAAEKEVKAEETPIKTENKKDNPLEDAELRKRLAMQALLDQQKTAEKVEAPEEDKFAKAFKALTEGKNKSAGSPGAKGNEKKYIGLLTRAVRANYTLPEVYNLKGANMAVVFSITISERGDLTNLELVQTSGDSAYDELTMQAIKMSAPLPKPPQTLVGVAIPVRFTP